MGSLVVVEDVDSTDAGGGLVFNAAAPEVGGTATGEDGEAWSSSYAFARATSVGESVSTEVVSLVRGRSIGGRSPAGDAEELARETRADAESRKLSSVDAEVEAWLERVSPASGLCESAVAISESFTCAVLGSLR